MKNQSSNPARPEWLASTNFMSGEKLPRLMAITARLRRGDRSPCAIRIRPDRSDLPPADLAEDQARFLDWVSAAERAGHPEAIGIVHALGARGVTDTTYPFGLDLLNLASNADLSADGRRSLAPSLARQSLARGAGALGRNAAGSVARSRVGDDRIEGGRASSPAARRRSANPQTGIRDADTLAALRAAFGHQDFGIYATVIDDGRDPPRRPGRGARMTLAFPLADEPEASRARAWAACSSRGR